MDWSELVKRRLDPARLERRRGPGAEAQPPSDGDAVHRNVGQARAFEALRFALDMPHAGYNLYVAGEAETGMRQGVETFLRARAAAEPVPDDVLYVNNFDDPRTPRCLRLPAGRGAALKRAVTGLLREFRSALPAAFDADDYRSQRQAIEHEAKEAERAALEALRGAAEARNLALLNTPMGLIFVPLRAGQPLGPDEIDALGEAEKEAIRKETAVFQERLAELTREAPRREKRTRERLQKLESATAAAAVEHLIDEVRRPFADLPAVTAFFERWQHEVVEQAAEFTRSEEGAAAAGEQPLPRRYLVNLVVDASAARAAPVIYADNPTFANLVGKVEYVAQYGNLVTDFNLIKAGALLLANGGYLVVDARKVLSQPFAWEGLKRALQSRLVTVEPLGQSLNLVNTVSLEPEPVPLAVKVVLLGDRLTYELLSAYDPEFRTHFKVVAEFDDRLPADGDGVREYVAMLGELARERVLRPLDAEGLERMLAYAARLAGDAERLTARVEDLADLLAESDYFAGVAGAAVVGAAHVDAAAAAQRERDGRAYEELLQELRNGTLLFACEGERTGQVNALSVFEVGRQRFGRPSRVTAVVRLGRGELVDISREVELGGPLHSKGVLTLSGYLAARYVPGLPLSLAASLTFEQSYGRIDGDSASAAELFALLSAIAQVPIRQSLAVTGSVNQHGEVQAIGGVNEKIEGFFDACRACGFGGEAGVVFPASNVRHLVLRPDVVAAVRAGRFHLFPIATVDEGLELLTGLPAGLLGDEGYPDGTFNALVDNRLAVMAEQVMRLMQELKAEKA